MKKLQTYFPVIFNQKVRDEKKQKSDQDEMKKFQDMFDFPVNPSFMNKKERVEKLNFVDQYVSNSNIPVNEK
jgi:hypothetical protein